MSLGLILTLIFLVLKLTHNIDWSWFYVFLPVGIEAALWVFWFLVVVVFGVTALRKTR